MLQNVGNFKPNSVTSQKTLFFCITAVRTQIVSRNFYILYEPKYCFILPTQFVVETDVGARNVKSRLFRIPAFNFKFYFEFDHWSVFCFQMP